MRQEDLGFECWTLSFENRECVSGANTRVPAALEIMHLGNPANNKLFMLLSPMKIFYCLWLDCDLLLHTINTSILCYEIAPKSACALPYHSYWPYKNDGCHRCWNWKELEMQLLWSLSGIHTLPRMLLCTVGAKKTFNHLNAVTIIYGDIKLPVIAATIYNYMLTTSLCTFRTKLKSLTSSEGRHLLVK